MDRIVAGHDPEARIRLAMQTGFDDALLAVGELYHFLAIQGPEREDLLPLRKAGLNVVWTADLSPYRWLKVRILNGGHTFLAMIGLGLGLGPRARMPGPPAPGPGPWNGCSRTRSCRPCRSRRSRGPPMPARSWSGSAIRTWSTAWRASP